MRPGTERQRDEAIDLECGGRLKEDEERRRYDGWKKKAKRRMLAGKREEYCVCERCEGEMVLRKKDGIVELYRY